MVTEKQRHVCVIPCGGASTRLGMHRNKCLVEVNGKPVLQYVVEFWRQCDVHDFVFIVNGDGLAEIASVVATMQLLRRPIFISRGDVANLALAITLANPYVDDTFILALGDCLQVGAFAKNWQNVQFGCGVCIASEYELRKSYLVEEKDQRVTRLVEKPDVSKGLCGMGTWFLPRKVFEYIARLRLQPTATSANLADALQLMLDNDEKMYPVPFMGGYVNVTYPEDLETAKTLLTKGA